MSYKGRDGDKKLLSKLSVMKKGLNEAYFRMRDVEDGIERALCAGDGWHIHANQVADLLTGMRKLRFSALGRLQASVTNEHNALERKLDLEDSDG